MGYYAYSAPRLSHTNYLSSLQGLSPFSNLIYNYNQPEVGYEYYLQNLRPTSLTQEKVLRAAYPSLYNRYNAWVGEDFLNRAETTWTDWLGKIFDPNKELARMSPTARFEQPNRFGHSARWVSFG